jgi:phosphatidylserine/phosphatidylglycerophosphate/cardiolipin synthase-like enzyme
VETHIEIGVGKYIQEKFSKAQNKILVSTPIISLPLAKELVTYLEKGINIKIILSEASDNQTKKSIDFLQIHSKKSNSNKGILEIKIVDFIQAALIHAKIYIIDEKFAIIGSANLTEDSFFDLPEYIIIHEETDTILQITNNFFEIWDKYKNQSSKYVLKKRIGKLIKKFKNT